MTIDLSKIKVGDFYLIEDKRKKHKDIYKVKKITESTSPQHVNWRCLSYKDDSQWFSPAGTTHANHNIHNVIQSEILEIL